MNDSIFDKWHYSLEGELYIEFELLNLAYYIFEVDGQIKLFITDICCNYYGSRSILYFATIYEAQEYAKQHYEQLIQELDFSNKTENLCIWCSDKLN